MNPPTAGVALSARHLGMEQSEESTLFEIDFLISAILFLFSDLFCAANLTKPIPFPRAKR